MTLPETDTPDPADAVRPAGQKLGPISPWLKAVLALAIGIPAVVTAAGAITSPPMSRVPSGHILYLDADQPSEHTTLLRGLYTVDPNGQSRLILHEQEPQDTDNGNREWITEPAASPNGRQVAFVKQIITILEESHSIDNQIWVADVGANPPSPGRLLFDLSAHQLDAVTHLAWTPDGRAIAFVDGDKQYALPTSGGAPIVKAISLPAGASGNNRGVSNSSLLAILPGGQAVVGAPRSGDLVWNANALTDARTAAPSPDGSTMAVVERGARSEILLLGQNGSRRTVRAPSGWSLFGGRAITSVRWSPDGRYLGYTVSKPPVGEDEIFYIDLSTGKAYKLPFRCGQAAWDWAR